jgi:ubiquitin C-terminal hydrolase
MKAYFKCFLLITIIISYQTIYSKNKGLSNCGNSCYFNASLQALSHLDKFNEQLHADLYPQDNLLPRFYISLVNQQIKIKDENAPEAISCTDTIFDNHTEQEFYDLAGPQFFAKRYHRQEDAAEFIVSILDRLIDPETKKRKSLFFANKTTILRNLFNLESISEVERTCGNNSENHELLLKIELPIPDKKEQIPLIDCLNVFSAKDAVNLYCDKCKKFHAAATFLTIGKLPEYFVIGLKRFGYDFENNHTVKFLTPIIFPLKLEINEKSEFTNSALKKTLALRSSVISYKLLAFIVHGGQTAQSGHYWAYGKDKKDTWYLYEDSRVSFAGDNKNLTQNDLVQTVLSTGLDNNVGYEDATPYILFYELDDANRRELEQLDLLEPLQTINSFQQKLTQLKSSLQELKIKLQTLQDKLTALKEKLKHQ